jgi:hypothetical protein
MCMSDESPLQTIICTSNQTPDTLLPEAYYLDIRPKVRELRYAGKIVRFNRAPTQFKIVEILFANAHTDVDPWRVFYHAYGEGTDGKTAYVGEDGGPLDPIGSIRMLIHYLRGKLAPLGLTIQCVRRGYGYKLTKIQPPQPTERIQST